MCTSLQVNMLHSKQSKVSLLFNTAQSCLVEKTSGSACIQPGHPVHAYDVQLRILLHWEPEMKFGRNIEIL